MNKRLYVSKSVLENREDVYKRQLMDYITVEGEEVDFLVGTLKFPGNRRISPSFVQIYLNIKFQPAALHFLRRNPAFMNIT